LNDKQSNGAGEQNARAEQKTKWGFKKWN